MFNCSQPSENMCIPVRRGGVFEGERGRIPSTEVLLQNIIHSQGELVQPEPLLQRQLANDSSPPMENGGADNQAVRCARWKEPLWEESSARLGTNNDLPPRRDRIHGSIQPQLEHLVATTPSRWRQIMSQFPHHCLGRGGGCPRRKSPTESKHKLGIRRSPASFILPNGRLQAKFNKKSAPPFPRTPAVSGRHPTEGYLQFSQNGRR